MDWLPKVLKELRLMQTSRFFTLLFGVFVLCIWAFLGKA